MTTSGPVAQLLSERFGMSLGNVQAYAQALRDEDLLPLSGRGPSAATLAEAHIANWMTALLGANAARHGALCVAAFDILTVNGREPCAVGAERKGAYHKLPAKHKFIEALATILRDPVGVMKVTFYGPYPAAEIMTTRHIVAYGFSSHPTGTVGKFLASAVKDASPHFYTSKGVGAPILVELAEMLKE
jgi:hypothetical protein